jgi:ADP-heptose:LPS heptosyltransferase
MKILIIKPSSFGDIVQALPVANALKYGYPKCKITWVVFKGWEDLISLCPDIDETIIWDRKKGIAGFKDALKLAQKTQYDLIIDLQGLLRSAFFAKFAYGKEKIGAPGMKEFSNFIIDEVYPKSSKLNAALRNLEVVRYLDIGNFELKANIIVDDETIKSADKILSENKIGSRFITIFPFSRGRGKEWSIENYKRLIKFFHNRFPEIQVVILGNSGGKGKIVYDNTVDICGQTNLKELAALLSKSSLSIGSDNGGMHLSCMLNTPSIFIFGASDANETAPYIGKFSLVKSKNAKINGISVSDVFSKIEKWIK